MPLNVEKDIDIIRDDEIESDIVGHASLPDTAPLVVFLGSQRWVPDTAKQEGVLLLERLANARRKLLE